MASSMIFFSSLIVEVIVFVFFLVFLVFVVSILPSSPPRNDWNRARDLIDDAGCAASMHGATNTSSSPAVTSIETRRALIFKSMIDVW